MEDVRLSALQKYLVAEPSENLKVNEQDKAGLQNCPPKHASGAVLAFPPSSGKILTWVKTALPVRASNNSHPE